MRERNLLMLFLVLNVALAGAFVTYLLLSSSRQPKIVATTFPTPGKTNLATPLSSGPGKTNAKASPDATAMTSTNGSTTNSIAPGGPATAKPVFTQRKFTWQDVESPQYLAYIDSLRAVGCPEDKVRTIILADINELFAKKRLKEAVAHDPEWWRSEPQIMMVNVLQEKGRALEEQRRELIAKLLGSEALENEKSETYFWSNVQLTGPVLGDLSAEAHNQVQDICARSMERHQTAFWSRVNEGQPLNSVEMAKLREQTRADLRQVLNPEQLEEFLLRYSHNAHQLRDQLRGVEPTPEEFRKIFRVMDPFEHQMQLEYGGLETLSEKQRERHERQRDEAIRDALSPQRYQAYLLTKDPLYRQAQMMAMQFNAPPKAIIPIYQMTKLNESKRQKIINDASLTPQQKSEALNAVQQEQQQTIHKIVTEANAQR
jgi:hypothetical protein